MKTALIIIIGVICGYLIGNLMSLRLQKRTLIFEEMIMLLSRFENLIRYKDLSVNELVLSVSKSEEYKHLTFLKTVLIEDGNFGEKWQSTVLKSDLKNYLSNEEINEIISVGSSLGKTDKQGQISHLRLYKEILNKRLNYAEKEKVSKAQMFKKVGSLCGLAAAVVIV